MRCPSAAARLRASLQALALSTEALTTNVSAAFGPGTATVAPADDIGFDPKCITKTAPTGSDVPSWWLYSIDYDYIRSISGVAQCFHPKARSGSPTLGAYGL